MLRRSLVPALLALSMTAAACTSTGGEVIEFSSEDTTTTTSRSDRTTGTRAPSEATTTAIPATTAPPTDSTDTPEETATTTPSAPSPPGLDDLDLGDPGGDMSGLTAERSLGSIGDPTFPGIGNAGYDVASYNVQLDLTGTGPNGSEIAGEAAIELTAQVDLETIHLDLVGLEVDEVRIDDEPALFNRSGRELIIRPPIPLAAGDPATIFVAYHGVPEPIEEEDLPFNLGFQTRPWGTFVASEPVGAATWFPSNDHPQDKAIFNVSITVNAGEEGVGPGQLVDTETNADGSVTYVWQAQDPMSTYLASVASGHFQVTSETLQSGLVIRHAVHDDVVAATGDALDTTAEMITAFEEQFGPYPFESYGILVVPENLGFALENQTLSLFGQDIIAGSYAQPILAHELAHQWFGDHISPAAWDDIWLNEGFATWAEWWWSEQIGFSGQIDNAAAVPMQPLSGLSASTLFDVNVYWRGGLTLEALRREVGDEMFGTILREWSSRYGGGVASTENFLDLVSELAGQDASNVVSQWVFNPTMPELGPDR